MTKILGEPVITEKSTALSSHNKYTFYVSMDTTKQEIKKAFETVFQNRKVLSIQTLVARGHKKRTKRGFKAPRDKKKAIITSHGDRIEYFPEVS